MFKNKYCIKNNIVEIEVKERNRKEICLLDLDVFQNMMS